MSVLLEPKTMTRGIDDCPVTTDHTIRSGHGFPIRMSTRIACPIPSYPHRDARSGHGVRSPRTGDRSEIIFADGVEDVERLGGVIQGADGVDDPAGDTPHVAGPEPSRDAPHGEFESPLEQDPHLLVRMGVFGDDGSGLEADDREHQVLAGGRADLDAREDLVPGARPRGEEVAVRVGERAGVIPRAWAGHWSCP